MMSGDNFTEEVSQTRVVLGDLTNRPSKRGLPSISDDLGFKSGCGNHQNMVTDAEDLHFTKRVCSRIEIGDNTGNEKGLSLMEDKQAPELSATDSDIDTSHGNTASIISHTQNETREAPDLLDNGDNFCKRGTVSRSVDDLGDASRDSCASTGSMPANFWSCKKDSYEGGRFSTVDKQKNPASNFCTIGESDLGVGSKCGPVEWSRLVKSDSSKSFVLDRCTTLKGDAESLKACSCSFCMKAAYIWLDLHCEDIKGRMAALKKSQKEASILAHKCDGGKRTEIHGQGNSSKSSTLESDLTAQWKSLFHHMEDIFVHESNQLQFGYVALKDLRENCKMDLKRTYGVPSNKY